LEKLKLKLISAPTDVSVVLFLKLPLSPKHLLPLLQVPGENELIPDREIQQPPLNCCKVRPALKYKNSWTQLGKLLQLNLSQTQAPMKWFSFRVIIEIEFTLY
jgi:hypothetical protein